MTSTNGLVHFVSALLVAGCALTGRTPEAATANPPTRAIDEIRVNLGLPELPLEFIEITGMLNSPDVDLQVALYTDVEGRRYSLDPRANQVVEIDARSTLSSIPLDRPALAQADLRAIAKRMVETTTPDFAARAPSLVYEEGNKGDQYFFTWTNDTQATVHMRPFAQIGMHVTGELFAYYNTLSLK